jgi:hypothetical protein
MKNTWQAIKSRLGPIQFLDFTHLELAQAHLGLGKEAHEQVWRILDRRLSDIKPRQLEARIKQARECWSGLHARRMRRGVAESLRIAMSDYMVCLEAWAEGLDLAHFSHPALNASVTHGIPMAPYELALVLQHDNVGCQTGVYRYASGGVQLWHTEEDVDRKAGSRFDKLRIAKFQIGNGSQVVRFHTFIYPDLMPGPAFSWREDGYVQAIDTLLLNNPPWISGGMLVNIVCWLAIRLGVSISTMDMLESMHPFMDGYAMNLIWQEDRNIKAARYEFTGNRIIKSCLADDHGSYLFQVNYFSDRTDTSLRMMEALSERGERAMSKRVDRTVQALNKINAQANGTSLQTRHFFRLVTSRAGREWAYANKDVKAYFLCQVKPDEMEIWLGAGPAGREDIPQRIIQKI